MSHLHDHGGTIFTVARTLGIDPECILDFSASINPLGMSPFVREALVNSCDTLLHYPDPGHFELKQALSEFHDLPPDHFTIANGSTELIYNLPAIVPGKKALIISPSFSEYARALHQHRWEVRHFTLKPADDFAMDLDAVVRALACGADALFLCNPGNPGGTLYPLEVIEKIYHQCRLTGTFLVLDEAF
ncbi:MAG: aminotransferase class I/II-fold pyridoxal phosphate-dependent enzyme, partial [Desulfuromonadaceae bacterium]|nr:aminotransferase class I/II-fold pyridoxal phosphate-dependent enzyme [Desulfuromonadaceae bacterium]